MGRPDDGYSTGVFAASGKAMPPIDIQQLLRPSAYPHAVGEIRLRETHVSWVILTGDFSYKLKKPIKLEFLDMTSLSHRHLLCQEELRLNRRLAPDLYLDVVTVTRDAQGLRVGGPGTIVDYAVKMRQFDASEELPSLLGRDEVSSTEIARACGAIGPIPRECRAGRPDRRVRLSAATAPIGARQSGDPDRAPPGGNERSRARAPERLDSRRDARSVARIRGAAGARVRARMPRRSACGEHRAMGGPAHALRLSGIRSQPALHRRDERYRIPLHGSQELPAPGSGIATAERLPGDHR